ncbi:MAG: IS5/IS1182 family transposase, partial [Cyanobacteria bacterium P01_H01_bin.15]
KKKQQHYCSGKKKQHTLKSRVVIDVATEEIICSAHGKDREHDFALFKRSELKVDELTEVSADTGYQGIKAFHENSFIPIKKKKDKN